VSVTDACVSWATTEEMLVRANADLARALESRKP
jgi:3-deoxy-D-arabino-heptulosonate 7-phosphate (DAHP) synthase